MSLEGELKHLFGADVYAQAEACMEVLPNSKLIQKLAIHVEKMRELADKPDKQRDFVSNLPSKEKIALCRILIR